ncbi:MAG: hypothetical protein WAU96_04645, partial [Anaerolineae bacterium]
AIQVLGFGAEQKCEVVEVKWQIAVESDVAGYRIYRSESGNRAEATLVNDELVFAQGAGTSYGITDSGVKAGRSYTYWLEEVSLNGTGKDGAMTTITVSGCVQGSP